MAEEKKEEENKSPFVTNDLRVLLRGTDREVYVKDKDGKEHRLNPLSIGDVIDFEENIGASLFNIMNAAMHAKHLIFLLYLSLRKEGRSKEDVLNRKYTYTQSQVREMFDMAILPKMLPIFNEILMISGFAKKNPPEPTSPKDSTPEDGAGKA